MRWFNEFSKEQIFLINSELFKQKPHLYLNVLQIYFGLNQHIDYSEKLVFHNNKYCLKLENTIHCLGPSKGRNYSKIDDNSIQFLKEYYRMPNEKLKFLLLNFGYDLPEWLINENIEYGLE